MTPTRKENFLAKSRATKVKSVDTYEWNCQNIYRTTFTCCRRLGTMIIDGGDAENFVSMDMVEKLNLKERKKARPYQLVCVHD